MQCPFCKAVDARVVDSRETEAGATIRRRRQCAGCGRRFTTYERPETAVKLMIVKKDGSRVPYDRDKVLAGLEKACYKRPVSEEQLEQLVNRLEETIFNRFDREVPSAFIGAEAARGLRGIDDVAYVRFASVYREFRDVGEFIEEARDVMSRPTVDDPDQKRLFDG